MIFSTVQSLSRSWPTMVWYFDARPFCSRKPKARPVSRPRSSCSGASNMATALPPEHEERGRDRDGERERHEEPARRGELQVAADAVAAGAAAGQARAE